MVASTLKAVGQAQLSVGGGGKGGQWPWSRSSSLPGDQEPAEAAAGSCGRASDEWEADFVWQYTRREERRRDSEEGSEEAFGASSGRRQSGASGGWERARRAAPGWQVRAYEAPW